MFYLMYSKIWTVRIIKIDPKIDPFRCTAAFAVRTTAASPIPVAYGVWKMERNKRICKAKKRGELHEKCIWILDYVLTFKWKIIIAFCCVFWMLGMDSWKVDNTKRAKLGTIRRTLSPICGSTNFGLQKRLHLWWPCCHEVTSWRGRPWFLWGII